MAAIIRFPNLVLWVAIGLMTVGSRSARGDQFVFVLNNGGRVEGDWVNAAQKNVKSYVVKTSLGGQITLDRSQVKDLIRQNPAEAEYDQIAPRIGDTAKEHWQLAEWCVERRLTKQRLAHLQRVIELEPNHAKARYGLGYTQVDGEWKTRDDWRKQQGFVHYQGSWRTPQDVEILAGRDKRERAEREWLAEIRRLRTALDTDRAAEAYRELLAIRDPHAIRALLEALRVEPHQRMKLLYVELLGQIPSNAAIVALVNTSLNDPDQEVYYACLDEVARLKRPSIVEAYIKGLTNQNNVRVNRSAKALERLADPEAIGPMIAALVTTHQVMVGQSGGGGTPVSTSFVSPASPIGAAAATVVEPGASPSPSLGSGLSSGDQTKIVTVQVPNQQVLQSLVQLAGGVSFGFDQQAWSNWHSLEKRKASQSITSRAK